MKNHSLHQPLSLAAKRLLALGLALASPAHAENQTGTAGSANPAPFDNTQPSLSLRQVLITDGLYPTSLPGGSLSSDEDARIGEVRIVAFIPMLATPELDGRKLSIQTHQALYSIMGDSYGVNDQTLEVNVPDLTNRLALGSTRIQGSFHENGALGGLAEQSLYPVHLRPHDHIITDPTGSGAALDNHQPSLALSYFINGNAEIRAATWRYDIEGWLFADGRALSRTTQPGLFDRIGYTFGGSGDTFHIPDLRGRVPVGTGQGPDGVTRSLGEAFGSPKLALDPASLPPHSHSLPGGGVTQVTGSATPIPNHQPSIALHFAVVFHGHYPSWDSHPFGQPLPVIGEIRMFASQNLPAGMVPANGALYPISQNSAAYSLLGGTFGGDNRTVFGVPDLRGRAVLGTGSTLPRGIHSGQASITLSPSHLPVHSHTLLAPAGTIPNAGFEADTYPAWPGYSGANGGRITGWQATSLSGLNGRSHFPFTNNGTIPEGDQAAFLQSTSENPSHLSTRIHGLLPGQRYTLRFRANSREFYSAPSSSWSLDSGPLIRFEAAPPVGSANSYHSVSGSFLAGGPTADLLIRNLTVNDSALLVDAFELAPAAFTDPWQVRPWSGDSSTNLSGTTTHWAARFGSGASAVINGAAFLPAGGQNPAIASRLATTGFNSLLTDQSAFPTQPDSGSSTLAEDAIQGNAATLTLLGLNPGQTYSASFFFHAYGSSSHLTLSTARNSTSFLTGENGLQQGMRIDHTFTASASQQTFHLVSHTGSPAFALCGLALCQPKPELQWLDSLGQPAETGPLSFGSHPFGSASSPISLHLRNIGPAPLHLTAASLSGQQAAAFQIAADSAVATLAPGAHHSLAVSYLANQLGSAEAYLTLLLNDPDTPSLSLPLSGETPYNRFHWTLLRFGANASNPTLSGPDRDPDGDGVENLLEYATLSDPLAPDSPILQVRRDGPDSELTLRINLSAADLTFRLQRSTNLTHWTDILITGPNDDFVAPGLTLDPDPETSRLRIRDTSDTAPLYWRLKVEESSP